MKKKIRDMFDKIRKYIFSDQQRSLIRDCKLANPEEYNQWDLINILFPALVVLFPFLMYFIVPSNIENWQLLIFNGSISLIGVNILFSMSSYLIKYKGIDKKDKVKDEVKNVDKLSENMLHLRSKLNIYKVILIFLGGILYFIQIFIITPNNTVSYYLFVVITFFILIISIYIGKYMFIIRDDFIQKTFYKELHEPVIENKGRWESKYGKSQ